MQACVKCGAEIDDACVECPNCGVILAKARATTATAPGPSPVLAPAAAPPGATAQAAPSRHITLAAALSLKNMRLGQRLTQIYLLVGTVLCSLLATISFALAPLTEKAGLTALALSLAYGVYALILAAFWAPLGRSVKVLGQIDDLPTSLQLETFLHEQGTFWRRTGIASAFLLGATALGIVAAIVLPSLLATLR